MISSSQRPLPDNTQHSLQTSMHQVAFEPTISAGERPQTDGLDRAATGTGKCWVRLYIVLVTGQNGDVFVENKIVSTDIWYDIYDVIDILYDIWDDMIRYYMIYDTIRYDMIYDMIRYDIYDIWYDTIRYMIYDMIWYMIRYDMIRYHFYYLLF